MATLIILLIALEIISKVCKAIKDIALTIISIVGSLLGILILFRLIYEWILVPAFKAIKWICLKLWHGLRWLGNKMDKHFTYRNNITFP